MSRTLALRLLSTCLVVLAGLVVIGCSDHSGKSVSERLTGAPAIAQENGLSLTADPPSIVIDPDDPNTPTDPDNANKRYGETALTAICCAIGWPPVIGHLVACAISSLLGLVLVRQRLQTLVLDTFQSQPFGVA